MYSASLQKSCNKKVNYIGTKKFFSFTGTKNTSCSIFEKPHMITDFHKTNANNYEVDTMNLEKKHNTLDQLAGPHHMSARGNLLFALN